MIATSSPIRNLIINDVGLFESLLKLLIFTIDRGKILIHLDDLFVIQVNGILCFLVLVVSGVYLELLKAISELLVVFLESIDFELTRRYGLQKSCIHGFASLETSHHGLNISDTCCCFDLLESVIDLATCFHFFVHLLLHKVVPKLVDEEVISHLKFSGILALVSGVLCDLLILFLAFYSAFHRFFLVCDAALQFKDAFLAVTLLLLDVFHQIVKNVLRLKLFLLCLTSLIFLD